MLRRLRSYLIGLFIGFLLVFVFFKDRKGLWEAWLPADRIKLQLIETHWEISETASCQMKTLAITETQLRQKIEDAKVDLSESNTRGSNKSYILKLEDATMLCFAPRDSVSVLLYLESTRLADVNCP